MAVLPAEVEGDAPQLAPALEDAARQGVTDGGGNVVELPEGCAEQACAAEAAGADGYVLKTKARVDVSDIIVETTLVDFQGNTVESSNEPCEICTAEEAGAKTQGIVSAAVGKHPVDPEPEPEPVPEPVYEPEPEPEPEPSSKISPRVLEISGWSGIGVGVALLGAGIAMLVLNDRPAKNNCDGGDVDAMGNCRYLWNTLGAGIGLTVGGAVLAGAGGGLVAYARRKRGEESATVSLSPTSIRVRF